MALEVLPDTETTLFRFAYLGIGRQVTYLALSWVHEPGPRRESGEPFRLC